MKRLKVPANTVQKYREALDAVPILKNHFARNIAGEKLTPDELARFTQASRAIVAHQAALADLMRELLAMLLADYGRQLDATAQKGP